MKNVAFLAFFAFVTFLALSPRPPWGFATAAPSTERVAADEQRAAYQAVLSIAKLGSLDADTRRRLFYQLCSELRGCARECARELAFCAKPDTDPSQRAVLVASCAADYRQRRDRGEALHPDAWLKERLVRFLDAVGASLPAAERHSFEGARTQVRLLVR